MSVDVLSGFGVKHSFLILVQSDSCPTSGEYLDGWLLVRELRYLDTAPTLTETITRDPSDIDLRSSFHAHDF